MTSEQISAFTGLGTMIGLVVVAILNKLDARKQAKVTGSIHTLVNSAMGSQLRLNMLQAQRLADLTKGTAEGITYAELASEAERLYKEHQKKQAVVDATSNPKTMNGKSSDG